MAGTLPGISNSQRVDGNGKPLVGGKLYLFNAGTTTPATAYKDFNLTTGQEHPSPIVLDAFGQVPGFFLADGYYRARLVNAASSVILFDIPQLPAVGNAGDGGDTPASVDPTTVIATGDIKYRYGTGALSGFVRGNARTIGNASSGASERANSDTEALFTYLWNLNNGLTVSGGRGASAAADYAANKTIALPNFSGRLLAALDDLGGGAAGLLTTATIANPTTLGATGGAETQTLVSNQLPIITPTFTGTPATLHYDKANPTVSLILSEVSGSKAGHLLVSGAPTVDATISHTPAGAVSQIGGGLAHPNMPPVMLISMYIKL